MIVNGAMALGALLLAAPGPADAEGGRERFVAMLTARTPGQQASTMVVGAPGPLTPRQFALISQQQRLVRNQQSFVSRASQLAGLRSTNPSRDRQFRQLEARTLMMVQRNLLAVERQIQRLSRLQSHNARMRTTLASLQNQAALLTLQSRLLLNRGVNPPSAPVDRPPATPSR